MSIVLITAAFAAALAFILGITLGFFKDFFAVPEDPMTANIREVLPGANCGACGYPGCDKFASEVAAGNAPANACTVGGASVAEKIAAITGTEAGEVVQTAAVLACQGSSKYAQLKGTYTGISTCRGAKTAGGIKHCMWGCLGFGDCVKVCTFGALSMGENNLPRVDYAKCTGCGLCKKECPLGLFKMIAKKQKGAITLCSNYNPVKTMVIRACKIACFKCGICMKNCPQKCINMSIQVPMVDYSRCNSCGTCVDKCPSKAIRLLEKVIV